MRPRGSLVLAMVFCAAPLWADGQQPRVRGLDPVAVSALQAARAGSGTVRRMIERLERSDLVVYVRFAPRLEQPRAATAILSVLPHTRYVLISVTTLAGETDRLVLLGHELQHAVELAEAPRVRDRAGMVELYERIGWRDGPSRYETPEAQATGRAVRQELGVRERAQAHALTATSR